MKALAPGRRALLTGAAVRGEAGPSEGGRARQSETCESKTSLLPSDNGSEAGSRLEQGLPEPLTSGFCASLSGVWENRSAERPSGGARHLNQRRERGLFELACPLACRKPIPEPQDSALDIIRFIFFLQFDSHLFHKDCTSRHQSTLGGGRNKSRDLCWEAAEASSHCPGNNTEETGRKELCSRKCQLQPSSLPLFFPNEWKARQGLSCSLEYGL